MYKKGMGVPDNHTLTQTDTKWSERKGRDTDTYWYDEKDERGDLVAKYVVKDTTSMYPPQTRTIEFEKLSADGAHIKSGAIAPREV
ncbi:MAG: hypothetical protein ACYC6S_02835 [Desulfobulbia bacterium]